MTMAVRATTASIYRRTTSARARGGIVVLFALALVGLSPAPVSATGEPILLVHGYRGSASSFDTMKARFRADGRTALAISLPSQDNVVNARAIRDFIAARGWTRVDIVAHSMGGLSSRQFVKFLGGAATVDAYVSLGAPQYGLLITCGLPSWYGGQMCPTSTFLRSLNSGDDTPGAPSYATLYSTGDLYVPNSSSRLDGGACHIRVSGVSHSGLLTDAHVYELARTATDGGCPGTFVP